MTSEDRAAAKADDDVLIIRDSHLTMTVNVLAPDAEDDASYVISSEPRMTRGFARQVNRRLEARGLEPLMSESVSPLRHDELGSELRGETPLRRRSSSFAPLRSFFLLLRQR